MPNRFLTKFASALTILDGAREAAVTVRACGKPSPAALRKLGLLEREDSDR